MRVGTAALPTALAAALAAVALSACSRDVSLLCGGDDIYREARSGPPLRIPDDLSVPDETESLRIPDALPVAATDESIAPECLEAMPALGGVSDPES